MVFSFIATIVISFVLSAAGTYFFAQYARKNHKFMPPPKERDLHRKPTPRIGGLVMIASFTLVILAFNYLKPEFFAELGFPFRIGWIALDKRLLGMLLGGLVLAVVMAIDDIRGVKAGWKLLWQIIIWVIIVVSGIGIMTVNNPFGQIIDLSRFQSVVNLGGIDYHFIWLADLLFLVWLLGMMNAVNFIDGADGLAAGTGIIGFVTIGLLSLFSPAVHQPAVAMLAFVAAAVTAGVLVFNFYPAKVFLGDTGAMWIGFLLAILSVIYGAKLATLFLVLSVPIIDGFIVVIGRLMRGKNPLTTPDQTHVHHRFIRAGFSMSTSVLILYAISAIYGIIALVTSGATKWISLGILIILTAVLLIAVGRIKPRRQNAS